MKLYDTNGVCYFDGTIEQYKEYLKSSSKKCPVCGNEYRGETACQNCGFPCFKDEFLNQDELNQWMENTVNPCRQIWQKAVCNLNLNENKYQNAIRELKKELKTSNDKNISLAKEKMELCNNNKEYSNRLKQIEHLAAIITDDDDLPF